MTKKDYEIIAQAINEAMVVDHDEAMVDHDEFYHVNNVVVGIATALERENPRFNKEKFLKAAWCTL